jgi:hypothetical protein
MCVISYSCKKSSSSCSISSSAIVGTWKLTTINYKRYPNSTSINVYNTSGGYEACQLDDVYRFLANDTYDYIDSGIVCSPNGSYTGGTWSLSGNAFTWDGYPDKVTSFDCNSMSITENNYDTTGDVAVYVFSKD